MRENRESVTSRRVLVLNAASPVALTVCRALSRNGHNVGVTCRKRLELATFSRHTARYHQLPPVDGPVEPHLGELLATVRRYAYEVVVAVSDPEVARLAEIELPVPSCPGAGSAVLPLIDKRDLDHVCRSCDVAYPLTIAPRNPDEDDRALMAAGFPAFVKARRSALPTSQRVVHLPGAQRIDGLLGGRQSIGKLRAAGGDPIVQQSVQGAKLHAVIIRRGGATSFRYAHRFLRDFRNAEVALETLSADSGPGGEAIAMLERICDATGYAGLVQAEFYVACRDGRLYLFDVNPRLWGSTWFPEQLGLQVAERALRDATGEDQLDDPGYPAGLRCHNVLGELRWARANPRRLSSILRTTRPGDVYHPSLRDPVPVAFWLGQKVAGRSRERFKQASSRRSNGGSGEDQPPVARGDPADKGVGAEASQRGEPPRSRRLT